jgi:hypothetical protein
MDSIPNGWPPPYCIPSCCSGGQTINIYTGNITSSNTLTLTGVPGLTTLYATGNIYASNSVTTTNVYATRYYGDGGFLSNITATFTTLGAVVTGRTTSYNVLPGDYYIGVSGPGVTVQLPLGSTLSAGKTYVIKDEAGNQITLAATSPNLIDGSATVIMNRNYMALQVLWTGGVWSIV